MKARRLVGLFIVIIVVLTTVVAFAAGDSYVVIKDKKGLCKVIKAKEKHRHSYFPVYMDRNGIVFSGIDGPRSRFIGINGQRSWEFKNIVLVNRVKPK
jgi:hypothetical protein